MHSYSGSFITLEGGEGTGKSTLAQYLLTDLQGQGYDVLLTREPGGSEGAEHIRTLLVRGNKDRWDAVTEYLLLSASRRDHCEKTIIPALRRGCVVICDRFFDSSLAYQGCGYGLDKDMLKHIYTWIAPDLIPDLTFVLDIDPEVGLKRSLGRLNPEDRYEALSLEFHRRVRQGFLDFAEKEPHRFRVLDGSLKPDIILKQALEAIKISMKA